MNIEIDPLSGFCFGVENAVHIAENALDKGSPVYSLGAIVHNDKEVERLTKKGLITTNAAEFETLTNCRVLIRAHGETPATYAKAERQGITIIDATCPIVKKVQEKIRETWEKHCKESRSQIVIFGKSGHAEVIGLLGQTDNKGLIVSSTDDLYKIDFRNPIFLFSQTTMGVEQYRNVAEKIREQIEGRGLDSSTHLTIYNTICHQVSNREESLRQFAIEHDVIVFVSGQESSNGKMLYNICKETNQNTHFISSPQEIKSSWFEGFSSVGICGATSTPKWLIQNIYTILSANL